MIKRINARTRIMFCASLEKSPSSPLKKGELRNFSIKTKF